MTSRLVEFDAQYLLSNKIDGFTEIYAVENDIPHGALFSLINNVTKFSSVFDTEINFCFEMTLDEISMRKADHHGVIGNTIDSPLVINVGIFNLPIDISEYVYGNKTVDLDIDLMTKLIVEHLDEKGLQYFFECIDNSWKYRRYHAYAFIPYDDSNMLIEIIKHCTDGESWGVEYR